MTVAVQSITTPAVNDMTATVTTPTQNLHTGDFVVISGATQQEYNTPLAGAVITVTGPNTFTYTLASASTVTQATGPITATDDTPNMTRFDHIQDMFQSPQPAFNFDSIAPTDPAWFVATATATKLGESASDVSALEGVAYRTLTWSGSTATLSATTVVPTPAYSAPINSPQFGVNNTVGTNKIDANDDRLLTAFIRNDQLWTARTVGVNSSGTGPRRKLPTAMQRKSLNWIWKAGGPTVQSGREYDTATSNPVFYYYPSLMVNGAGYMVMSFTGSSSNEYAGVYSTSLLPTQTLGDLPQPVTLLKAGEDPYVLLQTETSPELNRWGDYAGPRWTPAMG